MLLFGKSANAYVQIGTVMLIGIAAKTAILIVEFGKNRHARRLNDPFDAVRSLHQRVDRIAGGKGPVLNRALSRTTPLDQRMKSLTV